MSTFTLFPKYPGPKIRAAFHFPELRSVLRESQARDAEALHDQYGHVVWITPNALSYTSAEAWKDTANSCSAILMWW
jgi:hypothetical protein